MRTWMWRRVHSTKTDWPEFALSQSSVVPSEIGDIISCVLCQHPIIVHHQHLEVLETFLESESLEVGKDYFLSYHAN